MHTDAWHEMGRRCAPRVARAPPRLWPVQMTRLGCRPPESSASAFPRCRCGFSSSMTAANCCRKPAQPQRTIFETSTDRLHNAQHKVYSQLTLSLSYCIIM